MLGQRSLYHDGWLASTVHPPLSGWGNFDEDEWELYHLETDRAQTRNVAGQPRTRRVDEEFVVLLRRHVQRAPAR
jgi:arylsulfatase